MDEDALGIVSKEVPTELEGTVTSPSKLVVIDSAIDASRAGKESKVVIDDAPPERVDLVVGGPEFVDLGTKAVVSGAVREATRGEVTGRSAAVPELYDLVIEALFGPVWLSLVVAISENDSIDDKIEIGPELSGRRIIGDDVAVVAVRSVGISLGHEMLVLGDIVWIMKVLEVEIGIRVVDAEVKTFPSIDDGAPGADKEFAKVNGK
ncbi:hypothetical protein B0O99DRAFT_598118 [Bisporella sp. PMI_857]|nr:hypothetical protein B0O99DRAFT_598118 [Bisporella sp. PMI_857]